MSENYSKNDISVIDISVMSLADALKEIEMRPYLWLPENNLKSLFAFINGWVHASGRPRYEYELMQKFQRYIELEYGVTETFGWVQILTERSESEQCAFKLFFNKFDSFERSV